MFGLGTTEIIVILLIILVLFGGSKLPQLGKGLGEGLRNFKDAFKDGNADKPVQTVEKPHSDDSTAKKS